MSGGGTSLTTVARDEAVVTGVGTPRGQQGRAPEHDQEPRVRPQALPATSGRNQSWLDRVRPVLCDNSTLILNKSKCIYVEYILHFNQEKNKNYFNANACTCFVFI